VKPTETWQAISGLFRTEQGRERVYVWMTRNYATLAGRVPPEFTSYFPFFVSGCSEQRLEAARKFFAQPDHQVDGTEANLAKVSDQISDCVNLREREGPSVAAYLRSLPAAP
jgi:alanyl aminopeptidase